MQASKVYDTKNIEQMFDWLLHLHFALYTISSNSARFALLKISRDVIGMAAYHIVFVYLTIISNLLCMSACTFCRDHLVT